LLELSVGVTSLVTDGKPTATRPDHEKKKKKKKKKPPPARSECQSDQPESDNGRRTPSVTDLAANLSVYDKPKQHLPDQFWKAAGPLPEIIGVYHSSRAHFEAKPCPGGEPIAALPAIRCDAQQ